MISCTSSERLIYVQFTSYVQGDVSKKYEDQKTPSYEGRLSEVFYEITVFKNAAKLLVVLLVG